MRINNIECRKYPKSKEFLYEIIRWEDNIYFNREEEYRKDGYVDSFGGDYLRKDGKSIQISMFSSKEHCYVIAWLKLNKSEPYIYLETVGERLLELSKDDLDDFFTVYKVSNDTLMKKLKR